MVRPHSRGSTGGTHAERYRSVAEAECQVTQRSRRASAVSNERADADADVDLNMCGDTRDLQKVWRAIQRARQLMQVQQTSRGARFFEILPGPLFHTRDLSSIQRFITTFGNTYFHAAGTCPMARTFDAAGKMPASSGIVDENLRVAGVDGLRVADASVVPLNGLPNAPIQSLCMVIGLKAANLIQEFVH